MSKAAPKPKVAKDETVQDPTPQSYAIAVVTALLKQLADKAGLSLIDQVDAAGWSAALVERLEGHGLQLPTDWADRPDGAPHHDVWPRPEGDTK